MTESKPATSAGRPHDSRITTLTAFFARQVCAGLLVGWGKRMPVQAFILLAVMRLSTAAHLQPRGLCSVTPLRHMAMPLAPLVLLPTPAARSLPSSRSRVFSPQPSLSGLSILVLPVYDIFKLMRSPDFHLWRSTASQDPHSGATGVVRDVFWASILGRVWGCKDAALGELPHPSDISMSVSITTCFPALLARTWRSFDSTITSPLT
ncbi:hypothetical protein MSAN_01105100 [Mycena sanguinolenta]|uniref:Uncharacterized protein n=1 Tax=Mycena sanguinolenta TaxID=230812 RepID=A0A8H6YNM8_9AGAR|nr:hypothetical protein MSAN_01105100 [Mycena sanguinolenta]